MIKMVTDNGMALVKAEDGAWLLVVSPSLTYEEFESCMAQLLSSPTTPDTVMIAGQKWSYADLSNRGARMLLHQSIGGENGWK